MFSCRFLSFSKSFPCILAVVYPPPLKEFVSFSNSCMCGSDDRRMFIACTYCDIWEDAADAVVASNFEAASSRVVRRRWACSSWV